MNPKNSKATELWFQIIQTRHVLFFSTYLGPPPRALSLVLNTTVELGTLQQKTPE